MENQKDKETRTLIRIAASFDEGGNAVAAVDFYGETDPKKQLKLLGGLIFEALIKTDARAKDVYFGEPKAFPGSKAKLHAFISADGNTHVSRGGADKDECSELLRCAVAGWLAENPKYSVNDISLAGICDSGKRYNTVSAFDPAFRFLSDATVALGRTLSRIARLIVALRLIASIFKR